MTKRRPRIHWSGASNRARAKKYPEADDSEVERLRGDLTISDEDFAATNNGWVKAVRIFESPSIVRTRLGGSIIRPLSRVDSKQYLPVLDEALKSRLQATFTQPNWTNDQPRMGVPIWSDDPMRANCFATEGIIAEPPEARLLHCPIASLAALPGCFTCCKAWTTISIKGEDTTHCSLSLDGKNESDTDYTLTSSLSTQRARSKTLSRDLSSEN